MARFQDVLNVVNVKLNFTWCDTNASHQQTKISIKRFVVYIYTIVEIVVFFSFSFSFFTKISAES